MQRHAINERRHVVLPTCVLNSGWAGRSPPIRKVVLVVEARPRPPRC
ncbi:hypothetical protein N136_01078 [Leifsonia aquatica ATCC 14665]|uniref:Uncharacterized protein n=1 Tax=Leifsonia aquatica ATCC 14665 TaxID=1358026 RepID=U2RUX3_LEIAQ|nr:hypothetical protein N136_01078 [Leifsonia aquatica ATCC 14665]